MFFPSTALCGPLGWLLAACAGSLWALGCLSAALSAALWCLSGAFGLLWVLLGVAGLVSLDAFDVFGVFWGAWGFLVVPLQGREHKNRTCIAYASSSTMGGIRAVR